MSQSKFKIGSLIKCKKEQAEGHVVMIMNPMQDKTRLYYCSMYPGAMPMYEYVEVVDLNCSTFDNDGRLGVMQALNTFREHELEQVEHE
jgi:hypothetical protein